MMTHSVLRLFLCLGLVFAPDAGATQNTEALAESGLRAILEVAPGNDPARESLTRLLLKTGRLDAAAYHAQHLAQNARNPSLRRDAETLRFRLEGPAWGWQPIFALSPTSNLNKGSTSETILIGDTPFTIDADSRAQGGVGLTFGLSGWRSWRLDEAWRARLSGEASAMVYDGGDLDPQQSLRANYALDRRLGDLQLSLGVTVDGLAKRGKLERRRIGPSVGLAWRLDDRRQANVLFEARSVDYLTDTYRSGPTTSLSFGWRQAISPDLSFRLGVPFRTVRTHREHLDYDSFGISASIEKLWNDGGIHTSFGVRVAEDRYVGPFPGTGTRREDQIASLSLEVSNGNWQPHGFVPVMRYEFTRSKSNVSLYDYDSNDLQITFRKAF